MRSRKTSFPHFFLDTDNPHQLDVREFRHLFKSHGAVVVSTAKMYEMRWIPTTLAVKTFHGLVRHALVRDGAQRRVWTRAELEGVPETEQCQRTSLLACHDWMRDIARYTLGILGVECRDEPFVMCGASTVVRRSRKKRGALPMEVVGKGICTLYDHMSVEGLSIGGEPVGILLPGDVLIHAGARLGNKLRVQSSTRELYLPPSRSRTDGELECRYFVQAEYGESA